MRYAVSGELKDKVRERVQILRYNRGKSQRDFAEEVDIEFRTYQDKEQGRSGFSLYELARICNAFEIDFDYLLGNLEVDRETHGEETLETTTGLSKNACKRLENIRYKKGMADCISWFIESGILETLYKARISSLEYVLAKGEPGTDEEERIRQTAERSYKADRYDIQMELSNLVKVYTVSIERKVKANRKAKELIESEEDNEKV